MAAEQEQQNSQGNGIAINTFNSGINQDLAKTVYKQGNYLDALNITLLTDGGLSTAVVQNKKGTKLQIQFPTTIPAATYEFNREYPQVVPAQENLKVIEGLAITDGSGVQNLFFITKSNTVGNPNDDGYGQIWRCNFLGTTDNISGAINGVELTVNNHMMYNRFLNFKFVERIKAIGKYENENFSRIYWTDGINPLRSINTIGSLQSLLNIPVRTLNIVSESNLDTPVISRLIKGSLPEGKYQLAYRLLSKSGDLTNFSTCSNLIDVIEGNEFNSELGYPLADTIEYTTDVMAATDNKEVIDSDKGIEFYIPRIDKDYEMIQYALIYYSQPNLPEIFVYPYKEISLYRNQYESFTDLFSDTFLLTTEEFNIMYAPFEKVGTIEVKDNILFAANTTNEMFKVNIDYRAYRYNDNGECTTYELDGNTNTFTTNYPNNDLLDVINPYNDESGKIFGLNNVGNPTTWYNNHQYKYKQDGVTLGGQGPNIGYTFGTTQIIVDSGVNPALKINRAPLIKTEVDNNSTLISVPNHVTNNNGSFSSLKSPYKASCQVSWQRGEVYRFGITFYNKKGQASYVNWIGDIKMPDFNETNNPACLLSTFSSNNAKLTMYSTYIDFDVNVPQDLAKEISGFRIVYVERQENDKTRFGTAITGGMQTFDRLNINDNPFGIDYTISIIATVICYKIGNYIDEIDGSDSTDPFNIKENIREKIMQAAAATIYKKINSMPSAAQQRVTSSEDLADLVDSILDGAVNTNNGFFSSILSSAGNLIKLIFPKTIEKIKESIKEDLRKVLAYKVAGLHPNVYSLGQIGFANAAIASSSLAHIGYTISPNVDFGKYEFKQGDYLKPIHIFNQGNKATYELHRDSTVGLYNILDSSAYLRKWYGGSNIPWNEVADSDVRRIYINNQKVLIPGELLGSGFDNVMNSQNAESVDLDFLISNSYVSSIPQANKRGEIISSFTMSLNSFDVAQSVQQGIQNAGGTYYFVAAESFLKKIVRPHTVLGIGDKKHLIITNALFGNNGIPVGNWFENYEEESYQSDLLDPKYQSKDALRFKDHGGDYTVTYCRPISNNQYGGVGYSSRANNEYIPASEYYSYTNRVGNTVNIKAGLGDTYIGVYDAVNYCYYYNQVRPAGYQDPIRSKKGMYEIFPCEASFNFSLREGNHPIISLSPDDLKENSDFKTESISNPDKSKLYNFLKKPIVGKTVLGLGALQFAGRAAMLGPIGALAGGAASLFSTNLLVSSIIKSFKKRMIKNGPDTANLVLRNERFLLSEFKYNDVFNQKYNIQKYFPPSLFYDNEVDQYTNRIWHSQVKIDGEVIDSWRNFQFVDYLDVEGTQGPIVELVVNKNKIFFYQTNGVGIASSNERGAVQGTDGNIVLTNNKVLLRYDYITKETGTSHQYSVVNTNSSIYHYDSNLKKIFQLGEGLQCISDNLGLFSKLQSVNNDINKRLNTVHGIYDTEYQTVYYTFLDPINSNNSFTLSYNEKLNAFESFYSFKPKTYFRLNTMVFGSMGDKNAYWHNKGDYGSFYGTTYPSKIKVLTNDAPLTTKVWDNQKFQTQVYNSNGVLLNNETFDYIQHKTENQDTGLITLTPQSNIVKKERDWKLIIPRDTNSATYSTLSKPRLRDMYLETEITYTNQDNQRFILHPITTFYRQSIH
jgi:hypothetical protein